MLDSGKGHSNCMNSSLTIYELHAIGLQFCKPKTKIFILINFCDVLSTGYIDVVVNSLAHPCSGVCIADVLGFEP